MDNILKEYWGLLLPLLIMQFFKDPILAVCEGVKFSISKTFNEGDNIVINGEDAIIEKIGLLQTKFRMKERKVYFFVPNSRVKFLKLEIREKGEKNAEV